MVRAKSGSSRMRTAKSARSIGITSASPSATAEVVRGSLSISAISPKISPGCMISTARPRSLISTCPRRMI